MAQLEIAGFRLQSYQRLHEEPKENAALCSENSRMSVVQDELIRYIGKVKENPFHENATYLRKFNPFGFVTREKKDEALLKFADLASFSVYQCVNKIKSNFNIPEPRYLHEISKRFGCDAKGVILGTGIKCIHKIDDLDLDDDIKRMIVNLRASPPSR